MQTAIQKLNKKFTDCKNHRDFYMYFKEHKDELMDDERMQIEIAYNTGGINEVCYYIDNEIGIETNKLYAPDYYNETYIDGK
jgi:hypothetical protein